MGYEKNKFISIMNILEGIKYELIQLKLQEAERLDYIDFLHDEINKIDLDSLKLTISN